jgi:hypothetical protein
MATTAELIQARIAHARARRWYQFAVFVSTTLVATVALYVATMVAYGGLQDARLAQLEQNIAGIAASAQERELAYLDACLSVTEPVEFRQVLCDTREDLAEVAREASTASQQVRSVGFLDFDDTEDLVELAALGGLIAVMGVVLAGHFLKRAEERVIRLEAIAGTVPRGRRRIAREGPPRRGRKSSS